MSLEEREAGLLRLIEAHRDRECAALLDAARAEAGATLARAWQEARALLREGVAAERAGARSRIQAARAERATRGAALGGQAKARLLALAWPRLRAHLAGRWADPAGRLVWTGQALAQAGRVLPAGVWTIRHAPGWGPAERQAALDGLAAAWESPPRCVVDASLEAGLAIACGGALLDATLEGLLKDRARIESRLLALLGTDGGEDGGTGA